MAAQEGIHISRKASSPDLIIAHSTLVFTIVDGGKSIVLTYINIIITSIQYIVSKFAFVTRKSIGASFKKEFTILYDFLNCC